MKRRFKITVFVVAIMLSIASQAQQLSIKTKFGFGNEEAQELASFLGVERIEMSFVKPQNARGKLQLLLHQIRNGKAMPVDSLLEVPLAALRSKNNKVPLEVMAQERDENLRFRIRLPGGKLERTIAVPASPYAYALHELLEAEDFIAIGERKYLLGYFLPYVKDDMLLYCAVSGSSVDPQLWGQEFGVPNYFLLELVWLEE